MPVTERRNARNFTRESDGSTEAAGRSQAWRRRCGAALGHVIAKEREIRCIRHSVASKVGVFSLSASVVSAPEADVRKMVMAQFEIQFKPLDQTFGMQDRIDPAEHCSKARHTALIEAGLSQRKNSDPAAA